MTTLLALDTSSDNCSVALWRDGEVIDRRAHVPRGHTHYLMPMIDEVLAHAGVAMAELDALAYGHGPGSFTGVRIAAGVAQGLAWGCDRPLLGISTLRALALAALRDDGAERVLAALDARLGELYVALYGAAENGPEALLAPCVTAPEALVLTPAETSITMVGSGVALFDRLPADIARQVTQRHEARAPQAADMVRLAAADFAAGIATTPLEAVPVYLRDRVAHQKPA
ncbi:tRNA (adenosine(37)-N6)-threonylcarbamoyltransferase complex dimerization subunit type 1 TsaB [Kushneria aurantia]|uniref:tRNA threonylcarbamoyladenosine biosynthesis protein TsaB n=1 Tax=Kushneria aurantia TaxID=504092 RepID=A0ABV6G287_9GAMM|nr:tRNA (adenosine(37)-N6)-threonylcarbamoyltransferase complex dimerization subunit type 1 TsaB [Kushneria aurantia]